MTATPRELNEYEQHIADLLSNAAAKLGMDVKTTPLDGRMRPGGLNRLRDAKPNGTDDGESA